MHKILTGRAARFDTLRQAGGLSGYPCQAESEHDIIENSHASTALCYADGLAKAYQLRGLSAERAVVAVIGDGALTGGMAWEALNNIAAAKDRPIVIVVNDNERSYAPTIGGLANHLATLRTTRGYERFLDWGKGVLGRTPVVGQPIYETLHGVKKGLKDIVAPQGMFEDLGLKYVGPIDGHDVEAVESALRRARAFGGPVIVHCITSKGLGYAPAENDEADRFHGVGVIDPETGRPLARSGASWTSVFADEMVAIGAERQDVVAITAAMLKPVGLDRFAREYPNRVFDVGIAEQHAVTSAAGLAMGGMHPVAAVYATFLNRAFDQVLMDVALHRCGVTFVLDRAGVTGEDGPSHNGMWDMSLLHTVLRFPKATVGADVPAVESAGGLDVLRRTAEAGRDDHPDQDVLIVSVGTMAETCLEVADRLAHQGIHVTVVDPRWIKPVNPALVPLAARHRLVVTVEDNGRVGGVGTAIAQTLHDAGVRVPVRHVGLPQRFLAHGKRTEVLAAAGLAAQDISRDIVEAVARLDHDLEHLPQRS